MIAAQIAAEAGLIPVVDPAPMPPHPKPLRQTGSDMAFLKERAAANFFDVYVHWDKLYFQFPRPQTEALMLEWGRNLISFEPRIASAGQTGMQVIRGYNQELAQTIVSFAMAVDLNPDNLMEQLGSAGLDLLISFGRSVLHKQAVESPVDGDGVGQIDVAADHGGPVRGHRQLHRPARLAGRHVRDHPRRGQAFLRHLPRAQGHPHAGRLRLSHQLRHLAAAWDQPAGTPAQELQEERQPERAGARAMGWWWRRW